MSRTADRIYSLIQGLAPLYEILDLRPLSTSERKAMSAILCDQASDLVHCTAAALARPGALFSDIPVDPQALKAAQDDADAFLELRAHLIVLYRLCMDAYLSTQSRTLDEALAVLRRVYESDDILSVRDPRRPFQQTEMAAAESLFSPKRRPRKGRKSGSKARRSRSR